MSKQAMDETNWQIWAHHGITRANALWWMAIGVDPEEAAAWCAQGFDHPAVVRRWKDNGFLYPEEAAAWRKAGAANPCVAELWEDSGYSPFHAKQWMDAGIHVSCDADDWYEQGIRPEDAGYLEALGVEPEEAKGWDPGQLSLEALLTFHLEGLDFETAKNWVAAGFAPGRARAWIEVGHDCPQSAAKHEAAGYSPENPPPHGRSAAIKHTRKRRVEEQS